MSSLIALLFTISLLAGLALILSASGILDRSDSYLHLAREHQAQKQLHARTVHAHTTKKASPWNRQHMTLASGVLVLALATGLLLTNYIADSFLQIVPISFVLILIAVHEALARRAQSALFALAALTALLAVSPHPFIALITAIAGCGVIWMAGRESNQAALITWSGVALELVALSQVYWSAPRFSEAEVAGALCAGLLGLLLAVLSFAPERRALEKRDAARLTLCLAPALAVMVMTLVGPYSALENLLTTLLLVALGFAALAYVGWLSHGRLSYAKYFLTVALASLLLFAYLVLDSVTVTLVWFVFGVVVTAAGFTLPSYTARFVGLGLLVIGVLHYLVMVLGVPQISGPILLHDRVWLGLVIAVFLPVVSLWYEQAKLRGVEQRLVPVLTAALGGTSLLLLFAISYLDFSGVIQTALWLLVALCGLAFGRAVRSKVVGKMSQLLIGIALIKLLTSDIFSLTALEQVGILMLVAIVLIGWGVEFSRKR
jgi:hypothetical protein